MMMNWMMMKKNCAWYILSCPDVDEEPFIAVWAMCVDEDEGLFMSSWLELLGMVGVTVDLILRNELYILSYESFTLGLAFWLALTNVFTRPWGILLPLISRLVNDWFKVTATFLSMSCRWRSKGIRGLLWDFGFDRCFYFFFGGIVFKNEYRQQWKQQWH